MTDIDSLKEDERRQLRKENEHLRALNDELVAFIEPALGEIGNPLIAAHLRAIIAKAKEGA